MNDTTIHADTTTPASTDARGPDRRRRPRSIRPRSIRPRWTTRAASIRPVANPERSGRRGRRRLATALVASAVAAGVGLAAPQPAGAIVDGEPTTATDHPWQVALVDGEGQFCGGSLVSDRVVVTAAHCVVGTPASAITVRAGVTDLATGAGQQRAVTTVIEQPKYVTGTGDIAMLVLDRPFDASAAVGTIATATAAEVAAATTATVTGWGSTSETGDDTPSVLQQARVPLVDDATCAPLGIDAADELCAGGTGTDSCYGDSGGPLVIRSDRGPVLAGVTSWGEECGGPTPGVYAEVPTFADWIAARVADPDAPAPDRLPAGTGEFDEDDDTWDDDGFEEWGDTWDDDGWGDTWDDDGWGDTWDDAWWGDTWDDDGFDEWDDGFDDSWDDTWDDGFDDEWDDEYGDTWDDDGWCALDDTWDDGSDEF